MDFDKLLSLEGDELPEINDAHFHDDEQRLYRTFLDKAKNEGITIPLIWSERFKAIRYLKNNPKLIETIKKFYEEEFEKNPNKNKGKFEQVHVVGEEFMESVPFLFFIPQSSRVQAINLLAQKKHSIRDLIYDVFPLYLDDEVELVVKLHGKTYIKAQGTVKGLKVKTDDVMEIPAGDKELTMMTVQIKLLKGGDYRRRHEESSNIFDVDKAREAIVNKDAQEKMFKLFRLKIDKKLATVEKMIERAKLYNIDIDENPDSWEKLSSLEPIDFGAKKISDIRDITQSFYHISSNEKMLKFQLRLDLELKKMENWLSRKDADGKKGYFKY